MRRLFSRGPFFTPLLGMVTVALLESAVFSQSTSAPAVVPAGFGGWQSAPSAASRNETSTGDPSVKQAMFQAPGDYGLTMPMPPSLPEGMPPGNPAGLVVPAGNTQPGVLPPNSAFNSFANPGGYLPPTDVQQASGSAFRDAPPHQVYGNGAPGGYPVQPYGPQFVPTQGYGQPNIYPPGYAYGQPQAVPDATLRSIPQNSGTGGVVLPPQQPQMVNGMAYGYPIVTQDPRFVSPPPTPRAGNFATVPYRQATYQTNTTLPVQSVQPPFTQANQPASVQSTSGLPQYQPRLGATPVNYQPGAPGAVPAVAPGVAVPPGGTVPAAVAPPVLPPNMAPHMYATNNAGHKPLFTMGQENYNVQLGRGIIGQPTVYVTGQPIRNFLRYISP